MKKQITYCIVIIIGLLFSCSSENGKKKSNIPLITVCDTIDQTLLKQRLLYIDTIVNEQFEKANQHNIFENEYRKYIRILVSTTIPTYNTLIITIYKENDYYLRAINSAPYYDTLKNQIVDSIDYICNKNISSEQWDTLEKLYENGKINGLCAIGNDEFIQKLDGAMYFLEHVDKKQSKSGLKKRLHRNTLEQELDTLFNYCFKLADFNWDKYINDKPKYK